MRLGFGIGLGVGGGALAAMPMLTGLALDSSSAIVQPFSSTQLAHSLDPVTGDFHFRAGGLALVDFRTTPSLTGTCYFFDAATPDGEVSLRLVNGTFTLKVKGVDSPLVANYGNCLSWAAGDYVELEVWVKPSAASGSRWGLQFKVNNCYTDGISAAGPNYVDVPQWVANTHYSVGDIIFPTFYVGDGRTYYYECTVGGTSGASQPNPWSTVVGGTQADNTVTWRVKTGNMPAAATPFGAPTTFYLGSDGSGNNVPIVWDYCGFLPAGTQYVNPAPTDVFLGDSTTTSWIGLTPVPSQLRTVAEARAGSPWAILARAGVHSIENQSAFSTWRYRNDTALQRAWIMVGVNELTNGSASVIAANNTLIATGIRGNNAHNVKIMLSPIIPHGTGDDAVWDAVTTAQKGLGGTPVVDPGSNIVYLGALAALDNGTGNLLPQYSIDTTHQTNSARALQGGAPGPLGNGYMRTALAAAGGAPSVPSSFSSRLAATAPAPSCAIVASAPFVSPAELANLVGWYRSDLGVTLNGSNVSAWADQSPVARPLTQASAGNQPLYVAGAVNGLPVLRLNGSTSFMTAASSSLSDTSKMTAWIVMRQITWVANSFIFGDRGANAFPQINQVTSTPRVGIYNGTEGATASEFNVGSYGWVRTIFDVASSSICVGTHTAVTGNPGAGSLGLNGWALGAYVPGNIDFANIDVAEIVVQNAHASAQDISNMNAYLTARYGASV